MDKGKIREEKLPKVSVFIACYNHENYIAMAIESVLAQTYTDYELIVADHGCTDKSGEIISRYADKIQIVKLEENNPTRCMQLMWEIVRGEYIAILCSDDYWYPDKLEEQMKAVEENGDCGIFFTWTEVVDESMEKVIDNVRFCRKNQGRADWIAQTIKNGTLFEVSSMLIRNDGRYQKYYRNVERYRQLPDLALYFNMLLSEEVYVVEKHLVKKRRHDKNISAPTYEASIRTLSENAHIQRDVWNRLSDDMFINAFSDCLSQSIDVTRASDVMCNRILYFLRMAENNRWLGQEAIEYCWDHYYDEQVAELLEKKYNFTLKSLYEYVTKLGIGKLCLLSPFQNRTALMNSVVETLGKIVSALAYEEIRNSLINPVIQSIEMLMKTQLGVMGDKLLECYKYALCLDDSLTDAEWLEMRRMLTEVLSDLNEL